MIRFLQGQVHSCEERSLILVVNGVGYEVFVPVELIESQQNQDLSKKGILDLHIYSHIREDAFTLYGFRTKKELNFFELLLKINGVGPKMALAILNEPPEEIQNAIFNGNLTALTKISGVGKKIAERIVLELKSKVTPTDLNEQKTSSKKVSSADEEAIGTLETLGYKRHHIARVLSQMDQNITETEEIIRVFLRCV